MNVRAVQPLFTPAAALFCTLNSYGADTLHLKTDRGELEGKLFRGRF